MCFLGALLPNHQVQIGKLSSPHCQVGAPTPNWQVHFALWTAPMSFKLPAHFFNFWAAKGLNIFLSAKKSAPKVQTAHDSPPPHRLPPRALPSLPFSSLSLSFFIYYLAALRSLHEALLKIQTTFYIIFWTYWEQNWKVSSSNFMLSLYLFWQWCALEALLLEWISHQENLETLKDEIKFNKEIWLMIYFTHVIVHSQFYFLH